MRGYFISSLYDSRSDEVVKLEDLGVDLKSQKSTLDGSNQSDDFAVNELNPLAVESSKKKWILEVKPSLIFARIWFRSTREQGAYQEKFINALR